MPAIATVEEAPTSVVYQVPTTPDEIAQIGTQLSLANSEITGHGVEVQAVSSYSWNLSYDFNLNWRVAVGSPATGHKPSCASRDLVVVWTVPS
jgi:hypothetical protein